MAGGTNLLVRIKEKEVKPRYLMDLKAIPDLNFIQYAEDEGSLTKGKYFFTLHRRERRAHGGAKE